MSSASRFFSHASRALITAGASASLSTSLTADTTTVSETSNYYKSISGTDEFMVSLTLNMCLGLMTILIISFLRRRMTWFFDPRRSDTIRNPGFVAGSLYYERPPRQSTSFFGWIGDTIMLPENLYLRSVGVDMVFFLRFCLRFCFYLSLFCFIVFVLIIPIQIHVAEQNGYIGFNALSIRSLSKNDTTLFWHLLIIWAFTLLLFRFLHVTWDDFISLRTRWLSSEQSMGRKHTLIITHLPHFCRSNNALFSLFNSLYPGQITAANVLLSDSKLERLYARRENLVEQLNAVRGKAECRSSAQGLSPLSIPPERVSGGMFAHLIGHSEKKEQYLLTKINRVDSKLYSRFCKLHHIVPDASIMASKQHHDDMFHHLNRSHQQQQQQTPPHQGIPASNSLPQSTFPRDSTPPLPHSSTQRDNTIFNINTKPNSTVKTPLREAHMSHGDSSDVDSDGVIDSDIDSDDNDDDDDDVNHEEPHSPISDDSQQSNLAAFSALGHTVDAALPSDHHQSFIPTAVALDSPLDDSGLDISHTGTDAPAAAGAGAANAGPRPTRSNRLMTSFSSAHRLFSSLRSAFSTQSSRATPISNAATGTGFITTNSALLTASLMTARTLTPNITSSHISLAPEPQDIIWSSLRISTTRRQFLSLCMNLLFIALVVFWTVPVTLVSALLTVQQLSIIPWLEPILEASPSFRGFLSGFLSSLAFVVFMALLPTILMFMGQYAGVSSFSKLSTYVLKRYFVFQLVNFFLIACFSSSVFLQLRAMIDEPSQIPLLLGKAMPESALLFVNYIQIRALYLNFFSMFDFPALLLGILGRLFTPYTPKAATTAISPSIMDFESKIPESILILIIAYTFATIQPLILVFASLYFATLWFVYRFRSMWTLVTPFDTGASFWPLMFQQIMCGIIIGQVCIFGIFSLKRNNIAAILMLPLIAYSVWFWYHYFFAFVTRSHSMSLVHARAVDVIRQLVDESNTKTTSISSSLSSSSPTTTTATINQNTTHISSTDHLHPTIPISSASLPSSVSSSSLSSSSSFKNYRFNFPASPPTAASFSARHTTPPTKHRLTRLAAVFRASFHPLPSSNYHASLNLLVPQLFADSRARDNLLYRLGLPDLSHTPNLALYNDIVPQFFLLPSPVITSSRQAIQKMSLFMRICRSFVSTTHPNSKLFTINDSSSDEYHDLTTQHNTRNAHNADGSSSSSSSSSILDYFSIAPQDTSTLLNLAQAADIVVLGNSQFYPNDHINPTTTTSFNTTQSPQSSLFQHSTNTSLPQSLCMTPYLSISRDILQLSDHFHGDHLTSLPLVFHRWRTLCDQVTNTPRDTLCRGIIPWYESFLCPSPIDAWSQELATEATQNNESSVIPVTSPIHIGNVDNDNGNSDKYYQNSDKNIDIDHKFAHTIPPSQRISQQSKQSLFADGWKTHHHDHQSQDEKQTMNENQSDTPSAALLSYRSEHTTGSIPSHYRYTNIDDDKDENDGDYHHGISLKPIQSFIPPTDNDLNNDVEYQHHHSNTTQTSILSESNQIGRTPVQLSTTFQPDFDTLPDTQSINNHNNSNSTINNITLNTKSPPPTFVQESALSPAQSPFTLPVFDSLWSQSFADALHLKTRMGLTLFIIEQELALQQSIASIIRRNQIVTLDRALEQIVNTHGPQDVASVFETSTLFAENHFTNYDLDTPLYPTQHDSSHIQYDSHQSSHVQQQLQGETSSKQSNASTSPLSFHTLAPLYLLMTGTTVNSMGFAELLPDWTAPLHYVPLLQAVSNNKVHSASYSSQITSQSNFISPSTHNQQQHHISSDTTLDFSLLPPTTNHQPNNMSISSQYMPPNSPSIEQYTRQQSQQPQQPQQNHSPGEQTPYPPPPQLPPPSVSSPVSSVLSPSLFSSPSFSNSSKLEQPSNNNPNEKITNVSPSASISSFPALPIRSSYIPHIFQDERLEQFFFAVAAPPTSSMGGGSLAPSSSSFSSLGEDQVPTSLSGQQAHNDSVSPWDDIGMSPPATAQTPAQQNANIHRAFLYLQPSLNPTWFQPIFTHVWGRDYLKVWGALHAVHATVQQPLHNKTQQ